MQTTEVVKVETTVNNRDGTTENLPFDPISDFEIKLTKQHIQARINTASKSCYIHVCATHIGSKQC